MGTLTFKGKIALSSILPQLNEAASALSQKNDEVEAFLTDKQKGVSALQNRVTQLQEQMTAAQAIASEAQSALTAANQILEEAKGLTQSVSDALSQSGILLYQYYGKVNEMGSSVSTEFVNGLPGTDLDFDGDLDPNGIPEEMVFANIIIVGGDGGTGAIIEDISNLVGQIGGNVQEVVDIVNGTPS